VAGRSGTSFGRPAAIRAAALEALVLPAGEPDEPLARLVTALVPYSLDGCDVALVAAGEDEDATPATSVAAGAVPELADVRARVLTTGRAEVHEVPLPGSGSVVIACCRDGATSVGTVSCALGPPRPPMDDADVAAVVDVARLVGVVVGQSRLQRRARDAARHSQRLASQLHQLIAASIAVAGLQRDAEVLDAVATRARVVFDADVVEVSLDHGPGSPLRAVTRRPGDGSAEEAVPPVRGPREPVREGDWLVVPLLGRRGVARGTVAIRRRHGVASTDDDVEVAALLAQTASSALDATEMHRTILVNEERLRVLVDTAPIGIVETDLDGGVQWWNRAAAALFGWPEVGVVVPAAIAPSVPEAVRAPLVELWAAAAAGAEVTSHDLSGVELSGQRRELAASVALLPPSPGRRGSLLTVVEDVTDHRQLMEELRHAQRMEVIGQLSGSVAHDFNNLLTLIAGYAELLVIESADDERTYQLARDIQTTTTRASTLTGKLLTMGRTKLPEPVTFRPVDRVRDLAEVLDRILGADVALVLDLDASAGTIRSDPDQFEQMVMNLATNARDAMGEGGQLRVSIEPAHLDVDAAARHGVAAGEFVSIEVVDTGAGMDEDTLSRCFEPLFTTKGPNKGTGLGLPAARRVVVESGGAIEVRSTIGEGTTFEILFPAAGEVPAAAVEEAPVPMLTESATVLLAEDDDGIRELVARVLRHNNFDVLEAESAERALEIARDREGPIDLLVSDIVMSGMDGAKLAAALQADRPELLVVLVSGNVDESVVDVVAEGTGTFLPKPFKPSELMAVVAELRARRADASG
jgi:PAS domain S-box-containing protein